MPLFRLKIDIILMLLCLFTIILNVKTIASEWVNLRELDLRAAKKETCKITPEFVEALRLQVGL